MDYWSVINSFKFNIQSLAKCWKRNYTGFSSNNTAKFIDYQILVDRLIYMYKVEIEWKHKCNSSHWYVLKIMESSTFVSQPGLHTNLSSTCVVDLSLSGSARETYNHKISDCEQTTIAGQKSLSYRSSLQLIPSWL